MSPQCLFGETLRYIFLFKVSLSYPIELQIFFALRIHFRDLRTHKKHFPFRYPTSLHHKSQKEGEKVEKLGIEGKTFAVKRIFKRHDFYVCSYVKELSHCFGRARNQA